MSKLARRAAIGLMAATTAVMASAFVTSAEAGCRYYGPGSTGCAHKTPAPMHFNQPRPAQNFAPANPGYSYGRVTVNPNTFRSGGGILLNGSRRMGAAWVAPSCRRIGAALFC